MLGLMLSGREVIARNFGQHILVASGSIGLVALCLHGDRDVEAVTSHEVFEVQQVPYCRVDPPIGEVSLNLKQLREGAVRLALLRCEGNQTRAAALLGTSTRSLRSWLREMRES